MSSIGEKIYKLRSERGLTLEELAQKIGVGKSTVQKWETGSIKEMRRDKIQALADVLGVSPAVGVEPTLNGNFGVILSKMMQFMSYSVAYAKKEEPQPLLSFAMSLRISSLMYVCICPLLSSHASSSASVTVLNLTITCLTLAM
jgi:transcriptional regulator with XRE-family HTH domain